MIQANDNRAVNLLETTIEQEPGSTNALKELQSLLLFCAAFPTSSRMLHLAGLGLRRVPERARSLAAMARSSSSSLMDSGLAGSETIGCYSYDLVRWMVRKAPLAIALHSVDAPVEVLIELLRPSLPRGARELLDLPYSESEELVTALLGDDPTQRLNGLLRLLDAVDCADDVREALFNRMQVYVALRCGIGIPALSEIRDGKQRAWIHQSGLTRHVDLKELISEPVGPPISANQHERLMDHARLVLAVMQRETDPITYARAVEFFDMGRGLRIALFHLEPSWRLTFDSYVGFMAYKNGVPMAYGGAWVFPGKTRIGINVFPYMRGGESAWFFAQLLRLYMQRFKVSLFEAENYQLGHGNLDGLKSGAYWFYYRLGFRPWNEEYSLIAAAEFERMRNERTYRTPTRLLKRLVEDGLHLRVADQQGDGPDTLALLMRVSEHARTVARGDLNAAVHTATKRAAKALGGRWNGDELEALRKWALPLDIIPDWREWSAPELRKLTSIIKAKGADTETQHQRLLSAFPKLLDAWARLVGER